MADIVLSCDYDTLTVWFVGGLTVGGVSWALQPMTYIDPGMGMSRPDMGSMVRGHGGKFPRLTPGRSVTLAEHAIRMAIDKALGYMDSFKHHKK